MKRKDAIRSRTMGKKLTIIQMLFGGVIELRSRYFELKDWVVIHENTDRPTKVWLRFKLVETIFNARVKLMLA